MSSSSFIHPAQPTHQIMCLGSGWFPTAPGGLERYVYELSDHLAKRHNQVELCGVGLPETPSGSVIKLTNLGESTDPIWRRLWSVQQSFAKRQGSSLDAINLHFALYSFPILSQLPPGVPVTFTFHGPWAIESQQEGANALSCWLKGWIEKRVHQRCDQFIVLSQAFSKVLQENYRIPADKIHVIPGGVDLIRFQPLLSRQQARQQLNWQSDRQILFTPRRLVQRMGLTQLITAIAILKPKFPDIWLAIAGRGPLKSALEQQVLELGLSDQVEFLGFLPDHDLPTAYQAADMTIVPSQSLEGFGLVIAESLACGTPALCTPVGGMPEVVEPLAPSLVTSSCEVSAIVDSLESLLQGKLMLPSRVECREYAAFNFDWHKISEKVESVLLDHRG